MRKLVFLILSVLILAGQSTAQTWYSWRYRYHATDCTSITDGKETDLCYEVDSQVLYKCVPSIGACDTVGEWKRIEAVEADPIVKAITGIVKSNGTTISAAVAGTDYQTPLTADTHYLTPTTAASTYQPLGSYLTSESDPVFSAWDKSTGISISKSQVSDFGSPIYTELDPKISTLTSGKWCSTNGSVITCTVDPVTDTNTTYTASGSLLQLSSTAFSLKEGTLTNGKFCTYVSGTGLVCNSDANNYSLPTATDSVLGGIKVGSGLSITEGVLSATGGGYTNLTSFVDQTNWRLFYSDGSGDVKELALGSDGEYLKSNGTTAAPSWGTPTGGAHDAVTLAGQDYLSLSTQQITANLINGDNINWDTIDQIAATNVNWTTMTDLSSGGAVVWGNIAEGELADSTVVSADIKDGTVTAADTAITAGRSLTWSTNEINADAELYTSTLAFVLETPADADAFLIWKAPHAITITDIDCIVGAATSAVIDIQECDSAGANCATVDAAITCDADGAADDGSLSNAGIDAGDWLKLDIGTVTGTVKHVSGTITYTKND